jgi:hypothetical protein
MSQSMRALYIMGIVIVFIAVFTSCKQSTTNPTSVAGDQVKLYESQDHSFKFHYPSYLTFEGPDTLQSEDWTTQTLSDKSFKIDVVIIPNDNPMTLDEFLNPDGLANVSITERRINGNKFKILKGYLTEFENTPYYCVATQHNGTIYSLHIYATTTEVEKNIEEIYSSIVIQ